MGVDHDKYSCNQIITKSIVDELTSDFNFAINIENYDKFLSTVKVVISYMNIKLLSFQNMY